jgi:proton-coupled amino acid transporter
LINIIKANIGSGILGMPYAFKNGGIYLGTITLLIVAVITCHTTLILTECKSVLVKRKKRQGEPIDIHTYGDVGRVSMGIIGAAIIDILLVFTQTGFSCAYLIYIGTNMHAMVPQVEEWHAILIALALLVPLCLLRNIKYLTPTSIISEICIIGGMLIVIYYDIENLTTQPFPGNRNIEFFNWKDFPVFFGVSTCFTY